MAEYICVNGVLRPINHIYQCVDRLVEGIDFERADWLNQNTRPGWAKVPHIKLNFPLDVDYKVHLVAYITQTGSSQYLFCGSKWGDVRRENNETSVYGYRGSTKVNCFHYKSNNIDLELYPNKIINNVTNTTYNNYYWDIENFMLFRTPQDFTVCTGLIKLFTFESEEFNISLSPVKLLSPCPPNLSANGKPYAIGECGMIDSVSGKFFGNANTTGSFSVYND